MVARAMPTPPPRSRHGGGLPESLCRGTRVPAEALRTARSCCCDGPTGNGSDRPAVWVAAHDFLIGHHAAWL